MIINIIANARDAMDEKGDRDIKSYSKRLILKTSKINGEVCISIADNGIGMTGEEKERIFEPFYTTKKVGEATGLGMSISFGIIESHKGRIEVESAKGEGTEVKVFLPIKVIADVRT